MSRSPLGALGLLVLVAGCARNTIDYEALVREDDSSRAKQMARASAGRLLAAGPVEGLSVDLDVRSIVVPSDVAQRFRELAGAGEAFGPDTAIRSCGGGFPGPEPFVAHLVGVSLGLELDRFMRALVDDAHAEPLGVSRLVPRNGAEARFEHGCQIPFRVVWDTGAGIRYIDTVVDVSITPRIQPDGRIALAFSIRYQKPDMSCTVEGTPLAKLGEPFEGELVTESGQPVLISGDFGFVSWPGCAGSSLGARDEAHPPALLIVVMPTIRGD